LQDVLLTRLFRAVWATSPHFAERLERAYGLSRRRILYQPNFIDCSRFEAVRNVRPPKSGGTVSLLSVCRLRSWKGIETCLHAAARLKDVPFRWEFVGSGQEVYVASLRRLVRELGLEDRVHFHGEVPPNQIHEYYRKADLFVLLSDYEPFGIVLLEAMAAGVPIVATRTGGIPSVTDGDSAACLVEPGNPVMAAETIRSLLQDSEKRAAQVHRGLERLKEFSVVTGCLRLAEFGRTLARPVTPGRQSLPAETSNVGV
jgi:glycosyltransferase involved in cell wall biosynthesis